MAHPAPYLHLCHSPVHGGVTDTLSLPLSQKLSGYGATQNPTAWQPPKVPPAASVLPPFSFYMTLYINLFLYNSCKEWLRIWNATDFRITI